ncbi:MAG: hypothetical protein ABIP48_16550, partial [Planctomycetota bacterium]
MLVALGLTVEEASVQLGLGKTALYGRKSRCLTAWRAEVRKAQQLLARLGYDPDAVKLEPLRRIFEQVAQLLANGVRVFQESGEKKRLGAKNCPWSVEWRGLGEEAKSKVVGTKQEAERFANAKRQKLSFVQLSRDLGRSPTWLRERTRRHPGLWEQESRKAGLPDVWGPEFFNLKVPARLVMVRAAWIHASGNNLTTTERKIADRHGFWGGQLLLTKFTKKAMIHQRHFVHKEVDHGRRIGSRVVSRAC